MNFSSCWRIRVPDLFADHWLPVEVTPIDALATTLGWLDTISGISVSICILNVFPCFSCKMSCTCSTSDRSFKLFLILNSKGPPSTAMSAGGNTRPTWIRAWAQKRPLKLGSFSQQIWRVSGCAKLCINVWGRIMADPFYSTSRWHLSPPRKSWSVMVPTSWRSLRSPLCCCSSLCSALDGLGRPWTLCAQPISAPTVGATADIPMTFRPIFRPFSVASRKMSESQAIRPSSSNLSSDASWRLPTWLLCRGWRASSSSCWWSLQWPLCWWMQLDQRQEIRSPTPQAGEEWRW